MVHAETDVLKPALCYLTLMHAADTMPSNDDQLSATQVTWTSDIDPRDSLFDPELLAAFQQDEAPQANASAADFVVPGFSPDALSYSDQTIIHNSAAAESQGSLLQSNDQPKGKCPICQHGKQRGQCRLCSPHLYCKEHFGPGRNSHEKGGDRRLSECILCQYKIGAEQNNWHPFKNMWLTHAQRNASKCNCVREQKQKCNCFRKEKQFVRDLENSKWANEWRKKLDELGLICHERV